MSFNNGNISAPVSIRDLQVCFSNSSTDLGTLCLASNINKWARYKPIRYNKVGVITEAERRSVNYGLYIKPQANDDIYLVGIVRACLFNPNGNYWVYQQPRGANWNEPYRLSDFAKNPNDSGQTINIAGYQSVANPPFTTELVGAANLYSHTTYQYEINIAEKDTISFIAYDLGDAQIALTEIMSSILVYNDYRIVVDIYDTDPITTSSQIPIPIYTFAGDALTSTNRQSQVSISTATLGTGTFYALVGIMRVSNGNRVSGTAFIAPQSTEQIIAQRTACYFKLYMQNYLTMRFEVTQVTCSSNSGWFTKDGSTYVSTRYINGVLIVHMRVSRTSNTYYFATGTATIPPGGYRMQIYVIPYRWSGNYEAVPVNSSRQRISSGYVQIPSSTSTTTQWVDIYAQFEFTGSSATGVENILNDGYNTFALLAKINGTEQRDCGSFTIKRS